MVIFGNDTVTLYNRVYDATTETETWEPTLLTGVNLVITKGANITSSGLSDADTVKLYVDPDDEASIYVDPKEYAASTSKSGLYTFTPGVDFFVHGDTLEEAIPEENAYEQMLKTHDKVFRITTVDRYTNVLDHFEIGGR